MRILPRLLHLQRMIPRSQPEITNKFRRWNLFTLRFQNPFQHILLRLRHIVPTKLLLDHSLRDFSTVLWEPLKSLKRVPPLCQFSSQRPEGLRGFPARRKQRTSESELSRVLLRFFRIGRSQHSCARRQTESSKQPWIGFAILESPLILKVRSGLCFAWNHLSSCWRHPKFNWPSRSFRLQYLPLQNPSPKALFRAIPPLSHSLHRRRELRILIRGHIRRFLTRTLLHHLVSTGCCIQLRIPRKISKHIRLPIDLLTRTPNLAPGFHPVREPIRTRNFRSLNLPPSCPPIPSFEPLRNPSKCRNHCRTNRGLCSGLAPVHALLLSGLLDNRDPAHCSTTFESTLPSHRNRTSGPTKLCHLCSPFHHLRTLGERKHSQLRGVQQALRQLRRCSQRMRRHKLHTLFQTLHKPWFRFRRILLKITFSLLPRSLFNRPCTEINQWIRLKESFPPHILIVIPRSRRCSLRRFNHLPKTFLRHFPVALLLRRFLLPRPTYSFLKRERPSISPTCRYCVRSLCIFEGKSFHYFRLSK